MPILLTPTLVYAQGFTKEQALSLEHELKTVHLVLRPSVGSNRVGYVPQGEGFATFEFLPSGLFPVRSYLHVTLTAARLEAGSLRVDLQNRDKERCEVRIRPAFGKQLSELLCRKVLHEFLISESAPDTLPEVICNRRSRLVHLRCSNHLPDDVDRDSLATLSLAMRRGYTRCPVCFTVTPTLSDYELERNLGAYSAAQYIVYHPVIPDDSLRRRVVKAGRHVLDEWPVPLKGYPYDFEVSDDDDPNAVAFPGGRVFVTRGMLNSVEDDAELEAVLSHEIAHVERRHGLNLFRRAQTTATIGQALAIVAGIFALSRHGDPGQVSNVLDVGRLLTLVATQLVIAGYSRDLEEEADAFALVYATRATGRVRAWQSILSKLENFSERNGIDGGSIWNSHPDIQERVAHARGLQVDPLSDVDTFVGYDDQGHPVATLRLEAQSIVQYDKPIMAPARGTHSISSFRFTGEIPTGRYEHVASEMTLFASISTLGESETQTLPELVIKDAGGERHLFDADSTAIESAQQVELRYRAQDGQGFLKRPISGVSTVTSPGVLTWERKRP